mmetsp:Transcript_15/g.23  ORF Transcript_15/g.23 Transcript_15/m.23 type:complete len:225 (-) Transcript_15:343-1017(-)|eukprot:CAMPEP_0194215060 /NCGR_PEP_ID=MMETSP0156-20130528/16579_1 /TAXON_ID=33649 /ORGANISM="Thalassionema nitzschioides, Strain L26-B" /LENGTH=224 /DNA_ID=CAMNT_0038943479 /DNA_START=33 /DNA_END=707 /DNA_ORIENTATION=-
MKLFRKKKPVSENDERQSQEIAQLPKVQTEEPSPVTVHHLPPSTQEQRVLKNTESTSHHQGSYVKESPPPKSQSRSDRKVDSTKSSVEDRNEITRELVKKFVADIWNRGDLELIPEVCSKSLRFNGSVGMDRVGHDGFARMVTTIRDALNDYHCEIHSMVVEGNKAFCRMRFTGRHTGSLLGYPASGRQVAWMGAAEFTVKDSHIIKVWELGDVKSLEEQLSGS